MVDPRYVQFFSQYPEYIPSHDWRQHDAFTRLHAENNSIQTNINASLSQIQEIWAQIVQEEFQEEFQRDPLATYQTICEQLGIDPVPRSIKTCKARLQELNVNIVDFIQYRKDFADGWDPEPVTSFSSPDELREYSRTARKTLPVEVVTGPLKILLKKKR
jgi:hypothetical protein